ncbi:MAG: peroxiredoxin family protein [Acidobacteria bacterium]|nr:peroxiredoxin family protein [Acidobacteriota bacterium]
MELEQQAKAFGARGVNVAAVTYDAPAVLRHFATRRTITYPLLSDEGSKVIRAYGILNEAIAKDAAIYGVPHPVTYMLDARGKVKSEYVAKDYRERFTAANILVREFPAAESEGRAAGQEIRARHLTLRSWASNASLHPGSRVSLYLDIVLPPKMHVYAPGVTGYKPVEWKLREGPWRPQTAEYPATRTLHLKAIGEKVPVFEKSVRVRRDVVVGQTRDLKAQLEEKTFTIEGTFKYQACDDKVCYTPEELPLKWTLPLTPLDSQRVPVELRPKTMQ